MGRRVPQEHAEYTPARFREWIARSCENLGLPRLDLVQLHCPPTAVIEDDSLFAELDAMVASGHIGAYGVSVETCDQALTAITRRSVATVQIILNALRLKPLERVLPAAQAAGVGIIARVPLASGLLAGRYTTETTFPADDHRSYNRHGEAFDVGETFSGVDFEDRSRGGPAPRATCSRRCDDGPMGASVRPRPAGRLGRNPRSSQCAPGPRKRRRGNTPAALRRRPHGGAAGL